MTTIKVTNIQREVLEAAAIRNNHEVWPIRGKLGLDAGSATRTINQLIMKGLAGERPAREREPVWREDRDGRRLAAVISQEGLAAIGMLPAGKPGRRQAGNKASVAAKQAVVASVSSEGLRAAATGLETGSIGRADRAQRRRDCRGNDDGYKLARA